jgi:hypothetical protein
MSLLSAIASSIVSTIKGAVERKGYTKNAAGHFVCPHCGETKEKQNTMFYHMQTHEGKLPYECNVCKKGFVQKQELLLHKQRRHAQELKGSADAVVCPFDDCDFEDIRKGNVRIHCIRMHAREYISDDMIKRSGTQWSCDLCDYNCGSQAGLYYHLSSCLLEYGIIPPDSEFARTMEDL